MNDSRDAESWLARVLRDAPRRFAMPPLPPSEHEAAALGPAAALAWAMERARQALAAGAQLAPEWGELFVSSLASLVDAALQPDSGDPAFHARVLRAQSAAVQEHGELAATQVADRRRLRAAIDAVAHPARLREASPALHHTLQRLHELTHADQWSTLRRALAEAEAPQHLRDDTALHEALERLSRAELLARHTDVQRLAALNAHQAPVEAASSGARGRAAEQAAAQAFAALVERVNAGLAADAPRVHLLRGLLLPAGFPGEATRSKNEWDIALVRQPAGDAAAELLLLAEVKASPDAAAADLPILLRGLRRFAQVHDDSLHTLPCDAGHVRLQGASLKRLQPPAHALPPQVVYVSDAPAGTPPPWLDAAARGQLMAQPAVVELALKRLHGDTPNHDALHALWTAITRDGQLRSVLHQYDTARCARAALLHVDDLRQASGR